MLGWGASGADALDLRLAYALLRCGEVPAQDRPLHWQAHSHAIRGIDVKSFVSKKLVVGATGLILLGGTAGAVAATQSSGDSGRQAYVSDVAKHLGVSPSALTAAMKAAMDDRVDAAVAAGRLTQAQANALKQHIQQGNGAPFFGAHGFRHRGVRGAAAVAGYLGLSRTTLRRELQSGKSLAQIAASTPGKSVAGLKAAIVAAGKARLEQAVSSGRITAAQEQQWLAALPARIDALLQRTGHPGSHRGEGLGPFGH
jgi:hypothetical protein